MSLFIVKAGWVAFDVYGNQLAANDLTISPAVEVKADITPDALLAKGDASGLYTTLMNDANANPAVSGYVNPIPVAAPTAAQAFNGQAACIALEYQGYAIPHIFLYVRELTGP